jgi:hypothetical protein
MFQRYRGFATHVQCTIGEDCIKDASLRSRGIDFEKWMESEGFLHPDDPRVRGFDEEVET